MAFHPRVTQNNLWHTACHMQYHKDRSDQNALRPWDSIVNKWAQWVTVIQLSSWLKTHKSSHRIETIGGNTQHMNLVTSHGEAWDSSFEASFFIDEPPFHQCTVILWPVSLYLPGEIFIPHITLHTLILTNYTGIYHTMYIRHKSYNIQVHQPYNT